MRRAMVHILHVSREPYETRVSRGKRYMHRRDATADPIVRYCRLKRG